MFKDKQPTGVWVIVGPKGLAYIGIHANEKEAWQIFLSWPSDDEIKYKQRDGFHAHRALVTWTETPNG